MRKLLQTNLNCVAGIGSQSVGSIATVDLAKSSGSSLAPTDFGSVTTAGAKLSNKIKRAG